ncbi:unnamed protein product [Mytilus coruscus]|uniref:Neurotransmitter-gated ion-channel ligand-binding domain-containing protein n=1 Tax=Mytilus coruscus TaxID=42192 RepID=A0A6J8CLH5_MYTCO|nr:unnamed protein product [Mytilus coruscus]
MKFAVSIFCTHLFIIEVVPYNISEVGLLKKDLFGNYDRQVLPKTDSEKPVNVSLSFSLLSVYELDIQNQLLSVSAAFKISWKDELLTWNATKYSGLNELTITLSLIWKPDVIIVNSEGTRKMLTNNDDNHYVNVNHDGLIEWWVYVNLKTFCRVKMKYYPFETQTCDINITKAYLDDSSQILRSVDDSFSLDNYVPNGEWEISPIKSDRQTFLRSKREISGMQWMIEMKRGRLFYYWNFLMPLVSLSIAGCLTFILPTKSNEKLQLSIFVFLANGILIRLFNDSMPSISEETCLFGAFLWANTLTSGLIIVLNISITSLFFCKSPMCISNCCVCIKKCCKCKQITHCFQCCLNENHPEYTINEDKRCYVLHEFHERKRKKVHPWLQGECKLTYFYYGNSNDDNRPKNNIGWDDVSRHIDIFGFWIFFAIHAIIYAIFLTLILV